MMHLAYHHARPTWTILGGSFLTDPAALSDRRPASIARLAWTAGEQATSTTCTLRAGFGETSVRCVALLNTNLPAGLKIELRGRRAADADYTYALGSAALTQRLVQRVEGGVGAVWVLPAGLDPLVGLDLRLYNDVAGGVAIGGGDLVDVGEIVVSGGVDFSILTDWTEDGKTPSVNTRTLGSQAAVVSRPAYRVLSCTPSHIRSAAARGSGLSDGSNWQALAAALRADPYVVAVPLTGDADEVQSTSIYGVATRVPSMQHRAGPIYQPAQLVVEEVPS